MVKPRRALNHQPLLDSGKSTCFWTSGVAVERQPDRDPAGPSAHPGLDRIPTTAKNKYRPDSSGSESGHTRGERQRRPRVLIGDNTGSRIRSAHWQLL